MTRPAAQPCHSPFAEVGADRHGAAKAEELGLYLHVLTAVNTLIALRAGPVKFWISEPGASQTSDVLPHAVHFPRGGYDSLRGGRTASAEFLRAYGWTPQIHRSPAQLVWRG